MHDRHEYIEQFLINFVWIDFIAKSYRSAGYEIFLSAILVGMVLETTLLDFKGLHKNLLEMQGNLKIFKGCLRLIKGQHNDKLRKASR